MVMRMTKNSSERFVLRCPRAGTYLRVTGQDERIESVSSADHAWAFHSHEGAVTHALWIGQILGEIPDVVMLR